MTFTGVFAAGASLAAGLAVALTTILASLEALAGLSVVFLFFLSGIFGN
jgi:hypothetical protein